MFPDRTVLDPSAIVAPASVSPAGAALYSTLLIAL